MIFYLDNIYIIYGFRGMDIVSTYLVVKIYYRKEGE